MRLMRFRLICLMLLILQQFLGVVAKPNATGKIDSLEKLLLQKLPDTLAIDVYIELGVEYRTVDVGKGLNYVLQARKMAEASNNLLKKAKVYFVMANIYLNRAEHNNALLFFLKALRIYEQTKNHDHASRCLNNIGVVYSYLKNLKLSEQYFRESLALREKNGLTKGNGIAYTSIGYILSEKGNKTEAEKYYKAAYSRGIADKDIYVQVISLTNLGSLNLKLGNLLLAKRYLNDALVLNSTTQNYEDQSVCYQYLAEIAIKENNLTIAEKHLLTAKALSQKAGINTKTMDAYKSLSELYYKQQKYKQAYDMRVVYDKMNESILNENTYKQVNDIQTAYEIVKRNNQISLLNKDRELAEANANKQQLLRNIFVVLCVCILIIVLALFRNVRLKQRLNKTLKTKNTQLVDENIAAKYELLKSKVDPHFLFNSLNTLSSIVGVDKDKAIIFIEHFATLYRNILELGDLNLLSLADELKVTQNYIYLQQVRFGNKIIVTIDENILSGKATFVPPFAIQMAVENAIKHNVVSSAKNLQIAIFKNQQQVIIENNLQPKSVTANSTGIGQKTITERYKLFTDTKPTFSKTDMNYRVCLPLIFDNPYTPPV